MGCWNETCGISQLPIHVGDKIRAFILLDNTYKGRLEGGGTCYSSGEWAPFGISISGEYNDYGGIENIIENDITHLMLETLREGWVIEKEDAQRWDIPTDSKKLKLSDVLNAIERSCAKYNSFTRKGTPIGIMYVLEDVYQSMMNFNPIRAHYYHSNYDYKPVRDAYNQDIKTWYIENLNSYLESPSDRMLFRLSLSDDNLFYIRDNAMVHLFKNQFLHLIEAKTPFENAKIQFLCENFWEIIHFNSIMQHLRKLWHPQAGKGSQDSDLEIYKRLQTAVSNIIIKREKELAKDGGNEKIDENGYFPYMLEHNAKVHRT